MLMLEYHTDCPLPYLGGISLCVVHDSKFSSFGVSGKPGAVHAAVVNALDLEQVILVGHSMGGPVIVEAANRLPDRVIGLVGADTFQDLDLERTPEEVENILQPFVDNYSVTTQAYVTANMFVAESDSSLVSQIAADMAAAPAKVAISAARCRRWLFHP